jgi:folate-dependent tRNA-U54 methylase TrmFO/GidA
MKANFGILPPLMATAKKLGKHERGKVYSERALEHLKLMLRNISPSAVPQGA